MSEINANDVKILVKNVYVPTETQQFVVVDSLRVRTLKQMIAAALPGNPHPRHQKLIFGGKICDDEHTLAKVLAGQNKDTTAQSGDAAGGESAAPFVFHLMVSSSVPRSRPTTPVARPQPPAEETIANPTPTPASVDPTPAAATGGATPAMPQPAPAPHVGAGFPSVGFFGAAPATAAVPPPTTPAPAAASGHGNHHHHHFYAQAIMMQQQAMILAQIQYLQQLQAHHAASAQAGAATGAPQAQTMFPQHFAHAYGIPHHAQAFGHHAHAAAAHGLGGFPAPHLPGAAVPGVPVPPAAEVPAVVEPRERGPVVQAFREILPLFDIRLAMKMTFMLFIIGQDTPTDRLIVLALMSFGAYLHITGIIGKVFEILKRSRGVQGTNGDANGEPGANNANADGVHNHAPGRLGSITQYLRISADRGFLHDVRYFITGLLLSLVPAWHPQPLNIDPAAPAHPEPAMADAGAELPLQGI